MSSEGLETTVPLVGACFFGLFGLALPKWVKAVVEGRSGTVSSDERPPSPFKVADVLGVDVITADEFNKSGAALASSSTTDLGLNFRP